MKYMYQFAVILTVTFIGETLNYLIDLPIPASIYGLIIMFTLLATKIIKLEQVRETGKYLVIIMQFMFIPPCVAMIETWSSLEGILLPIMLITIVSTVVVFVVTGKVSDFIIDRSKSK
ncbi:MAG: CidA/LrgA family protein [Clostridia bacterium]